MDVIDPNARVADLVGLLYVLRNMFGGKTDLYQLEKEMEVDLDDLMPIVYTGSALGFVSIGEGDIIISDKGDEFLKAGLKRRKELLTKSLVYVEPFITALELQSFTVDKLMESLEAKGIQTFNSPSGYHDLEIILIEWGVYSGLLRKDDQGFHVSLPAQRK